jgi:hypothetical protein
MTTVDRRLHAPVLGSLNPLDSVVGEIVLATLKRGASGEPAKHSKRGTWHQAGILTLLAAGSTNDPGSPVRVAASGSAEGHDLCRAGAQHRNADAQVLGASALGAVPARMARPAWLVAVLIGITVSEP